MRHQLTPTFSPDGFGGHAAAQRQREAGNAAVIQALNAAKEARHDTARPEHRDYDDGLVHGHYWAKTSTTR